MMFDHKIIAIIILKLSKWEDRKFEHQGWKLVIFGRFKFDGFGQGGQIFFMYLPMTLVAGKMFFNCRYGKLIVRDATIFSNVILQHVIEFLCSIILKEGSYLEISKL